MSETAERTRPRRAGGRAAQMAARAAAKEGGSSPVHAGMEGGQYRPLKETDVLRIHEAALEALEVVGLANAPASGVEILTGRGRSRATTGASGSRARWSRTCWGWPRGTSRFTGAIRRMTSTCRGKRVHFGTAGAAVHVVDALSRRLPGVDRARPLRRGAARAEPREHPLLPAHDGLPRRPRQLRDGREHALRLPRGHDEARGHVFSEPHHVAGCMELIHTVRGARRRGASGPSCRTPTASSSRR